MAMTTTPVHPHVVRLGGVTVDLLDTGHAIDLISHRVEAPADRPLAVASINLDHISRFGDGSDPRTRQRAGADGTTEWLNLVDGAPVAAAARQVTGAAWPRLAGSDLIGPLLDRAGASGATVGFLGGSPATQQQLRERFAIERPTLRLAGLWSPSREALADDAENRALAAEIESAGVDLLVVCLGKPRQEQWIERYGALAGAHVMLAFGAVVDFLAGRVDRAPRWIADRGLEWAWRLAHEPRRLARRYLIDGPPAYGKLRRDSGRVEPS